MTPSDLSARQKEILALLAKGKSNKEIAFDLKVTEGTIKQHLFTLFRKLGVTNRLKATLKAAEILGVSAAAAMPLENGSEDPLSATYLEALPREYAWRLVTAVHIQLHQEAKPRTKAAAAENGHISELVKKAQVLAAILQGTVTFVPERELIVTFGAPRGHLDDASRAIIFARLLCRFMSERLGLSCGMGIATTTTLVSFSEEPLYRSEAYALARDLAGYAAPDQILATDLTCKMAGPLFNYKKYETADDKKHFIVKEVLWNDPASVSEFKQRVQLPFFNEVVTKAIGHQTQWVKVNGWPPTACAQLLDIIALHGRARNLRVAAIRLPSGLTNESLIKNLHHQLYLSGLLRILPGNENTVGKINGESQNFVTALEHCAPTNTVTMLMLYGVNSHDTFLKITQACDLTNLSNLPLVICTTGDIAHSSPELIVELLENHPIGTGKHLSYRLPLSESLSVPKGLARDLGTLLEILSPAARRAIAVFTKSGKAVIEPGTTESGFEIGKELLISGLFRLEDQKIVCRDNATLKALEHFFATN